MYDWGIGAFATNIQTFVFAAYFVKKVAIDEAAGSAAWGTITGIAAFVVALLSPFVGAAADQGGKRKVWLGSFTLMCILPTALLWYVQPSPHFTGLALMLVGIASIGAETAYIFYNSMLPELAPQSQIGRWSGWGWGMGYVGGTAALLLTLEILLSSDAHKTLLGLQLNPALEEPVRASFILTAVWITLFTLPIFLFTPSSPPSTKTFKQAAVDGFFQLWTTIREIRQYSNIVRFLIAKLFYVDGLATLFTFGGIYAAAVFKMSQLEVLQFGISLNVTAGIGAFVLGCLDDKIGSKKMILLSLMGLIIPGFLAIIATSKWQFWMLGLILGIFVGPVQASSRSFMARIAPEHLRNEMFGFYMLSGKATAFFGPLLYGWISYFSGSLRWGMSSVIFLFIIGGLVMLTVKDSTKLIK